MIGGVRVAAVQFVDDADAAAAGHVDVVLAVVTVLDIPALIVTDGLYLA